MPESDINMEEHWGEVQSKIESQGFLVFPNTILSTESIVFWPLEAGIEEYLDLAQQLERKIIYLKSLEFNSNEALELLLLSAPSDFIDFDVETVRDCLKSLGVENRPEAKDYLKTTKFYEGHRVSIRVEWVYDGIVHVYWRKPNWYAEISELAGKIIDLSESLAWDDELLDWGS